MLITVIMIPLKIAVVNMKIESPSAINEKIYT